MNLPYAVTEIFDMSLFYKMAEGCRPEEDNHVISCRIVEGFQIVYVLIFGDSSSRRSTNISLVVIYKMAECHRPEVENDVLSCQKVEGIQFVYILIFGEPTSRRSINI